MGLSDFSRRMVALAEAIHQWTNALSSLDRSRRRRVAIYADRIAETLLRARDDLSRLEADPADAKAARAATREFGRIQGYIATLVDVLRHHLDGRKLRGVKRRLELLEASDLVDRSTPRAAQMQIDRLAAAEGYFRALADALRT